MLLMNDAILNERRRDKPNEQKPSGEYFAIADIRDEK